MTTNVIKPCISSIKLADVQYHLKSVPFYATEAEWALTDYIPKKCELIVYAPDENYNYYRFKTGNGETTANNLPFTLATHSDLELLKAELNSTLLKREIVETKPEVGNENIIYMVPASLTDSVYDEWMYINGDWELIGNTKVDLEDYVTWEDWRIEYAQLQSTFVDWETLWADYTDNTDLEKNYAKKSDLSTLIPGYSGTMTGITAGSGLKITGDASVAPKVEIDTDVVLVLYGGTSTEVI